MNYSVSFGKLSAAPPTRRSNSDTFGLVVLGDFSGRANRGELESGSALATRKPRRVDVDNLDDVLASMNLKLCLPVGDGGAAVEVSIGSLDDFHPDELYENVEVFAELAGLRRRLQNSSTFDSAAAEVQAWGGPLAESATRLRSKPRGTAIPNTKLSDFSRLMGTTTAAQTAAPVDELVKQIVRPFIKPAASPDQAAYVAAVDSALSSLMRRVLHHPDFQTLESLWRSVDLMVRELETGTDLQIVLYDISAEEVAADLATAESLEESGLYKLLVEQPALDTRTTAPSVIVGNFQFEQTPPHADLLGRIAKVAAASGAPFIAAIGNDALVKKKPDEIHPAVAESWQALSNLPHSAYLGLTTPRFMLRWPYGAKTEPIDPFDFEEFTPQFGLKGFLWGNGANLAGLLLAKTFAASGMDAMELGSIMIQGELPLYYYTDQDGDQIALPSTERLVSEAVAAHAISQGFMPLLWMRGRPEIRLGAFTSLSRSALAGPWAPVNVPVDSVSPPPAPAPAAAAPAPPPPAPTPVEESPDSGTDELDDLLSELDTPATPAPEASVSDDDDDLDALLASLEGEPETDDDSDDSSDIDPDLAALLDQL